MSSSLLLEAALNNASIPHQPYVLVSDEPTFDGVPLVREMIRRSLARQAPTLLISVLRPPSMYLPVSAVDRPPSPNFRAIDLTDRIPGYSSVDFESIKSEVVDAVQKLGPKVEIYIDAIDVLAEDYTAAGALALVRALLKQIKGNKAPSRLTLLLSPHSALYPSLLPPSLSASLTQLTPHPLPLLSALSTAYLAPISAEPRFCDLLDMAAERRLGERMAWLGESSLGDWVSGNKGGTGSHNSNKGKGKVVGEEGQGVAAVQVVVRKATGGAKGMSRSLEGLVLATSTPPTAGPGPSSTSGDAQIDVRPLASIIELQPFSRPTPVASQNQSSSGDTRPQPVVAPTATHTALNLPFNLSLTDEQRRRRDRVPIPYVHEGEGVEMGWEDEEEEDDDEEI